MGTALQIALASGGLFTGVVGLLVFVARLYFTGKLVPRSTVDDLRENYSTSLKREQEISTYYRVNNELITTTLAENMQLTRRLVEEQRLIKEFIFSLKDMHRDSESEVRPRGM